jgi:hypothetical protein
MTQSTRQRGESSRTSFENGKEEKMDRVSGRGNLWFIVLLSATDEELRRLAVTEMPDVPRQPARSADTLDKIGKQLAPAAEPLPFLYQG